MVSALFNIVNKTNIVVELVLAMYVISVIASIIDVLAAEIATIVATIIGLAGAVLVAYSVFADKTVALLFDKFVVVDPIAAWGMLVVSIVGFVAALYSIGYIRHESKHYSSSFEKKAKIYYMLFNITMLAMILSVISNNIIVMWVAIEATTLATVLLVGFYESASALEAAWKYAIVCGVGVGLALFGSIIVYSSAVSSGISAFASISWSQLIANSALLASSSVKHLLIFGIFVAIFGYMAKAGLFPLHIWLPDAHSEAPAPISALLSGIIVKCAIIAILRYVALAWSLGIGIAASNIIFVAGVLSMIVGGFAVYMQRDIKRLFAYSTIDQVGVIATAAGVGNPIGMLAAIMHIMYHALAKSLAFLTSGAIMIRTHGNKDITAINGLLRSRMKFLAVTISIAMLSIIAIPPGPSFYSKIYMLFGASKRGVLPAIAALLGLAVAEFALVYKFVQIVFGLGVEREESITESAKVEYEAAEDVEPNTCKVAMLILAILLLVLFVMVKPYMSIARQVADEVFNPLHVFNTC